MNSSSGYGSWQMPTNSEPVPVWQHAPNGVPQPAGSLSDYTSSTLSSAIANSSYPAFLGLDGQAMQQLPHSHQHQPPGYEPHMYHQPYASDPSRSVMSIDSTTFNQLRADYPDASPEELINAVFHTPQAQVQQQPTFHLSHQAPPGAPHLQLHPSHSQTPSQHDLVRSHSDNSLANALNFTSSTPLSANPAPSSAFSVDHPTLPSGSTLTSADATKKPAKLRQSKLTFQPGVAQSVTKKESPPAASPSADSQNPSSNEAPVPVAIDSGSEPGTPPLPRAKALAAKSSANGAVGSAVAAKSNAATAPAETRKLSDKAKAFLTRLRVEQEPQKAARNLVELLSDLKANGSFHQPRPTSPEDRKVIVETLNNIAKLETGKGYTDSGRKRFFAALMALPAARHILSTWLRATAPPKKVTEATPDHSRRYRDTLLPLLNILEYVDIKSAYLTDDAGLGKSIQGVSVRAVDPSARALATSIKAKWSKVVNDEDTRKASPAARPTSSASASTAASTPGASAASAKRKPGESAAQADSVKRYKSATAAPTAPTIAARKPTATASSSTAAKPALPFFATGNARRPTSTSSSSSANAASASRLSAHQNIMSLVNKLSGGAGTGASSADKAVSPSADAQKEAKAKKTVRFKADHELTEIRLIEPADYGQGDEEAVEGVDARKDEGLALRQTVSTMEASIEWREPRPVDVPMAESAPLGSGSIEGPFQAQRKADLEAKVCPEGEEPDCPDESELEQPGTISETPQELAGAETKEIPIPDDWIVGTPTAMGAMKEDPGLNEGDVAENAERPSSTITALPPVADLSALLSSVAQSVGANSSASTASETGTVAAPTPATAPAPAPALNFDVNQIRSIISAAKSNGANSNAVNAAMASSNVTSDSLSKLVSSLARSSGSYNAQAPSSYEAPEQARHWPQTYDSNAASDAVFQEESYPGEYQQDYMPATHQYNHTPAERGPGYDGRAPSSWEDSNYASYGGYQQGGLSSYGGNAGGRGGGWQSKRNTVQCKFFLQGNCRNGSSCNFRH
ncbi:hypothetical protein EX895_003646 [Sporisorium graminicola]|uniref:C3H1-type domain-containing protein n=1 Tax=Sporisorium graminicola TaxID=280036 RepID=A0A4V6YEM9_9BASI|nr:hypothetical protein EX895_003646 [Sporisorium graminicola]TKY86969.1 hypothetical protein EX895_003646 [Sporisorium graminicola]